MKHGYDERYFVRLRYPALSTKDEARAVIPELRRRHVKRYILVTSEFHTERAGRIFRAAGPDLELHVVASPGYAALGQLVAGSRRAERRF